MMPADIHNADMYIITDMMSVDIHNDDMYIITDPLEPVMADNYSLWITQTSGQTGRLR